MINIRRATEADVEGIRSVYLATYGTQYAYPKYYDPDQLRRMIFADDTLLLVAEDEQGQIQGTASVVLDTGAFGDLVGEFGRLAVLPEARGKGIGRKLMVERVRHVQDRLHVGIVENRAAHTFSQRISESQGFACVGFIPGKLLLEHRESVTSYVRYFGDALRLRRNNPRVIPEAGWLAEVALENCHLPVDVIYDATSPAYPQIDTYEVSDHTTRGYLSLLRMERGRIEHREIFGPLRLHYGLFMLRAKHSEYLVARDGRSTCGAVGFTWDPVERVVRIFELICRSEEPTRFLLSRLLQRARDLGADLVDVDVSAHAPRMQRTLLELGFLPAAYIPAMVFHHVERLDIIKMVQVLSEQQLSSPKLVPQAQPIAQRVLHLFSHRTILPRVAEAVPKVRLFEGLNEEQVQYVARSCWLRNLLEDEKIFQQGDPADCLYLVIDGSVSVYVDDPLKPVGTVGAGQCLGELALLAMAEPEIVHRGTALTETPVTTAVLARHDLEALVRRRPDIGVILFRNLAADVGRKLQEANTRLT